MSPTARDRLVGSIVAGAIGDALGAPVEFNDLRTIRRRYGHSGVDGYEPAYGRVGAITDDTQMTLFTAEGLLLAESTNRDDVVESVRRSYLAWLRTQDPGIRHDDGPDSWLMRQRVLHERRAPGSTCLSALYQGGRGTPGAPLNDSKGCGGVMRVAPVAAMTADWFEVGARVAALTHGHPSGFLSAGVLAHLVGLCIRGMPLATAIDHAATVLATWPAHDETMHAIEAAVLRAGSGDDFTPEALETLGGGWVGEEALAIGLCCALVAPDVRSGLLMAVNHGGDSDSTGSIAGNLLGAVHGVDALPADLLDQLEARDVIEQIATRLAATVIDDHSAA